MGASGFWCASPRHPGWRAPGCKKPPGRRRVDETVTGDRACRPGGACGASATRSRGTRRCLAGITGARGSRGVSASGEIRGTARAPSRHSQGGRVAPRWSGAPAWVFPQAGHPGGDCPCAETALPRAALPAGGRSRRQPLQLAQTQGGPALRAEGRHTPRGPGAAACWEGLSASRAVGGAVGRIRGSWRGGRRPLCPEAGPPGLEL